MPVVILGTLGVRGESAVLDMRRKVHTVVQRLGVGQSRAAQIAASASDHSKQVSRENPLEILVKLSGPVQLQELCLEFSATQPGDQRWLRLGFDHIEPLGEEQRRGWSARCDISPIATTDPAIPWCQKVLAEQTIDELVRGFECQLPRLAVE